MKQHGLRRLSLAPERSPGSAVPASGFAGLAAAIAAVVATAAAAQPARLGDGYPKLLGMNIGAKNYDVADYQDRLARLDVVILGFYPGWKGDRDGSVIRRSVQAVKRRNPSLLVGQYTVLNEAADDRVKSAANADLIDKLDREGWWLRSADGRKLQWTQQYAAWDINITDWAKPDANGDRYPQWLAARDSRQFFARVPEFDIWYFDNVMHRSRISDGVWKRDGREIPGKDEEIAAAFRRGMASHWTAATKAQPEKLLMGNPDNDLSDTEFRQRLHGAFLEGLMGKSWSIETRSGWSAAMERYRRTHANLRPPAIVGFNAWGRPDDYRFFRYAFASCLLGDGYFSFTDEKAGYSSVPWFDEYDVRIGKALEPGPTSAWSNGVYRRRYENAIVLVNPELGERRVTLEKGWKRLRGAQAPDVNDGSPAGTLVLPPRSGLLLVKQ